MSYEVKLRHFEGPIDLLIFFIHRDKINIYDIPISYITKEFLDYIQIMNILKINIGGEFVLMASMLMQIKAKMLLPQSNHLDDTQILDPRLDLVEKILEYKIHKDSAKSFDKIYTEHSFRHIKGKEMIYEDQDKDVKNYVSEVNLFNLLSTFKELIENLPKNQSYELAQEKISINKQIDLIRSFLKKKNIFSFRELSEKLTTKLRIVVTFMGLLELIRKGEIKIDQPKPFSEMQIIKL